MALLAAVAAELMTVVIVGVAEPLVQCVPRQSLGTRWVGGGDNYLIFALYMR